MRTLMLLQNIKKEVFGLVLGGVALYGFSIFFPMVKWTDKQPREISDLKKLKVVENY